MHIVPFETVLWVDLPWPPSVNHYWGQRVIGKRVMRFVGKRGLTFRDDVTKAVSYYLGHCQKYFCKPHRLAVSVHITSPDNRRRDVDNLMKATLDALEHAGVYDDDSQIDVLNIIRCTDKIEKGGRIRIGIGQIENGHVDFDNSMP